MPLFVIDGRYIQDHFPGIGRYTYNLIDSLARVAPDDSFVVLHSPALRNTRYDLAALACHPNVELRQVNAPTFSLREQIQLPLTLKAITQVADSATRSRERPAVFHSPYFFKPYMLRVPSIVSIFDVIPFHLPAELPNTRTRLFFRLAVWLAAGTAVRVLAPSNATRDDLVTLLHAPRDKVAVVPLAADARFALQPDAEIARVREKYSLPHDYVLSVGINKPHKNLETLMEAWRQIQDSPATLVMAGAWDARFEKASGRAGEHGRKGAGEIKFIHNVPEDDLPALYAGAAVFVMPSLYEGFGLPALEAMACGAPVIASNTSSLPEVVGDAARLFDPRDANMLAALLARVLNDRALRDELRAKSLARAKEFSWERTARETLAVYRVVGARHFHQQGHLKNFLV